MAWQWTPQFYQPTIVIITFIISAYLCQKDLIFIKEKNNYTIENFENYKQNLGKSSLFDFFLPFYGLFNLKSQKIRDCFFHLLAKTKNLKFLNLESYNLITDCTNNLWRIFTSAFYLNLKKIKRFCINKCCLNNNILQPLICFSNCSNIRFLLQVFILFSLIFLFCYGDNKFAQNSTIATTADNNIKLFNNIDIASAINGSKYAFI